MPATPRSQLRLHLRGGAIRKTLRVAQLAFTIVLVFGIVGSLSVYVFGRMTTLRWHRVEGWSCSALYIGPGRISFTRFGAIEEAVVGTDVVRFEMVEERQSPAYYGRLVDSQNRLVAGCVVEAVGNSMRSSVFSRPNGQLSSLSQRTYETRITWPFGRYVSERGDANTLLGKKARPIYIQQLMFDPHTAMVAIAGCLLMVNAGSLYQWYRRVYPKYRWPLCRRCGYDLSGNPDASRCSECGHETVRDGG